MLLLRAIVEKAADVLDTVLETALTPGVPLPGHWKLSTHVGSLVTESTAGQFGQFHSEHAWTRHFRSNVDSQCTERVGVNRGVNREWCDTHVIEPHLPLVESFPTNPKFGS